MLSTLILVKIPFMCLRKMINLLRTLARFLGNEISECRSRRSSYLSTFTRVELTRGVYFLVSVPEAEVELVSVGSGGSEVIQSFALSIDDAKKIFQSIERAYHHRDLAEIELGELWWKTDCRVRSNPEQVSISFKRGWERTRTNVRRHDLATAIANFNGLFGIN